MQREIKFRYRIQDKTGKIITQIYTLEEIEMGLLSKYYSLDYKILSRDQYTGLKDKNDKEIYGGDIVKHFVSYKEQIDKIHFVEDGWRVGTWEPNYLGNFEVEVIGNIYENPELLT